VTHENFTVLNVYNCKAGNCESVSNVNEATSEDQGMMDMQLKKLNDKAIEQLFEAILTLKDMEECYVFFDDLCTVNEIQSLSQRLEVARMLRKGSTYNQIEAETGASTATISRVKRCLNYGNDGYKMTLERLGR
jgi:TrpR-related protein YerC/YecD